MAYPSAPHTFIHRLLNIIRRVLQLFRLPWETQGAKAQNLESAITDYLVSKLETNGILLPYETSLEDCKFKKEVGGTEAEAKVFLSLPTLTHELVARGYNGQPDQLASSVEPALDALGISVERDKSAVSNALKTHLAKISFPN